MPKSRIRRRRVFTPPAGEGGKPGAGWLSSGRWVAPTMVALLLLGLAWIVVYYVAGNQLPLFSDLGGWNLIIGMSLITGGFLVATRWQ